MKGTRFVRENHFTIVLIKDHQNNILYKNLKYALPDIDERKDINKIEGIKYFTKKVQNQGITYYIISIEDLNGLDFEENITMVTQHLFVGIALIKNGKVLYRNEKLIENLHLQTGNLYDKPWEHLQSAYMKEMQKLITNDDLNQIEIYIDLVKGYEKWVLITKSKRVIGKDIYLVLTFQDIDDIKQREIKYNRQHEYLSTIINSIFDAVIVVGVDNNITVINPQALKLLQVDGSVIGKSVTEYLHLYEKSGKPLDYLKLNNYKSSDVELETLNGLNHYINLRIRNIDSTEKIQAKIISFFEISDEKKHEQEILYLTYHDILTGLYNRTFFEEQLKIFDNNRKLPLAIIIGDVNGLKLTNDVFGHQAGDTLLKQIARVLLSVCRQDDIVSRWGGDEFIILLPNTSETQVNLIVNRIRTGINDTYINHEFTSILPSLSLGHAIKTVIDEDIYQVIKVAENNMYKRKMLTSSSMYSTIITTMKNALYEHSNETEQHAERLYDLCVLIAKNFRLTDSDLSDLELFSKLHDIGKIGIPVEILNKPSSLTPEEREIIKTHPEIGFRIANTAPELKGIANFILSHHERYDGTGYPKHLQGTEIPLMSRILSVVDAYDAMTHDRTYRKAMSPEKAIEEINANSGSQFDPTVVLLFNKVIIE